MQTIKLTDSYLQSRDRNNTAAGLIIEHCSTSPCSSDNPSWSSSPPWDRCRNSLWGCSKVQIQGRRSSPADRASSEAGSNSPEGCSSDSGSALRGSHRGSWTPSWWGSRSRRRTRRRRSPVESSCWGPWGCRASGTQVKSREPENNEGGRGGCYYFGFWCWGGWITEPLLSSTNTSYSNPHKLIFPICSDRRKNYWWHSATSPNTSLSEMLWAMPNLNNKTLKLNIPQSKRNQWLPEVKELKSSGVFWKHFLILITFLHISWKHVQ